MLTLVVRRGPSASRSRPIIVTSDPSIIEAVGVMLAARLRADSQPSANHDASLPDPDGRDD